jgi:DNA gyrase subunit A
VPLDAADDDDGVALPEPVEPDEEAALAEPVPLDEGEEEEGVSSQRSYRTQGRGGKGVHDIKTTERNGPVIGIAHVDDTDEVMMITARGKIQRIPVNDVSIIGRNTQGVRIMNLDEADRLVAVTRVPHEEGNDKNEAESDTSGDAAATEPGPDSTDG